MNYQLTCLTPTLIGNGDEHGCLGARCRLTVAFYGAKIAPGFDAKSSNENGEKMTPGPRNRRYRRCSDCCRSDKGVP